MTNAQKLKLLMAKHDLKSQQVADLIGVSIYSVRAWLVHPEAGKHRAMKVRYLDHLKLKLKLKG